jgi:hypothetical protein
VKHLGTQRFALLAISVFPLILTAGCPVDATVATLPSVDAGTYWVEYQDGALAVFELPTYRGESGVWYTLEIAEPAWYTGPALYEVREDGSWVPLTTGGAMTLDDVLQTYDPAPRAHVTGR